MQTSCSFSHFLIIGQKKAISDEISPKLQKIKLGIQINNRNTFTKKAP